MSRNLGLLAGMISFAALPALATTHTIFVNNSSFSPATLTIEAGDTVIWESADVFFSHTTTSDLPPLNSGYWQGFLVEEGDTFTLAFNTVGIFTYHDQLDDGTGTITVIPPAPAGIVLASPRNEGSQFLFEATGLTAGKTNMLESSTNLTSWVAIQTNVAASNSATFTNATILPKRFFRLIEKP